MSLFFRKPRINISDNVLSAVQVQNSTQGLPISVVYGQNRVTGNNIWYGDFTAIPHTETSSSGGGKGGGGGATTSTTTYTYTVGIVIGLCEGPIVGVGQVWSQKDIFSDAGITVTPVSNESHVIDAGGDPVYVNNTGGVVNVSVSVSGGGGLTQGVDYTVSGAAYTFTAPHWGQTVLISYTYELANPSNDMTIFNGSYSQTPWSYLTTNHPGQDLGYRGIAYVADATLNLGSSGSLPNLSFEVKGLLWPGTAADVNPADVVADLLPNANYGAGFPSANLDALTNFRSYCAASNFLASPAYTTQRTAADIVTEIAQIGNSAPVWSSGSLKIIPYADADVGPFTTGVLATGGVITTDGTYNIHTFSWTSNYANQTFSVSSAGDVEYLVVAGGGGGGGNIAGGGGGGGVLTNGASTYPVSAGNYTVQVGGSGVNGATGVDGLPSIFDTVTATGGGGGGGGGTFGGGGGVDGLAGGSGGGGQFLSTGLGGAASPAGQGYKGGYGSGTSGASDGSSTGGGGGGGAPGVNGVAYQSGNGGVGFVSSITGAAVHYGGGGGGGGATVNGWTTQPGVGGLGGGGNGGNGSSGSTPGTNGLGGGGGGGGWNDTGHGGGRGVVILRYNTVPTSAYSASTTINYNLTDDDFIAAKGEDPIKITRTRQADAYNALQLSCRDRSNNYNMAVVEAKDQANIDLYGLRPMPPITIDAICDPVIGRAVAQAILTRALYIRNQHAFTLGWKYSRLEPMDLVSLTDANLGLNLTPVRITSVEEDADGNLAMLAEDFNAGVTNPAAYTPQTSGGAIVNQNVDPGNANTPVIFQPPPAITASGASQIWLGSSGGANWGGAEVWGSSDNTTYTKMGVITAPARHGVLTATLASHADPDAADTCSVDLTVSSGALLTVTADQANAFDTLSYVDGELISYETATLTSAYHYDLTTLLRRGLYGTTIGAHLSTTEFMRLDAAVFKSDVNPSWVGTTLYVKLLSFNTTGGGLQSLAAVSPTTYVVTTPMPNIIDGGSP